VCAVVLDKTGTLTDGRPRLVSTQVAPGIEPDELLMIAASLEQASHHTIAETIVAGARARGMVLSTPSDVAETPGEGLEGHVQGFHVLVGGLGFVTGKLGIPEASVGLPPRIAGSVTVAVAIERKLAGVLVLADELRAGTEAFLSDLRALGAERIVLATGDRHEVAVEVTRGLSFDSVRAELTPDQKIMTVLTERKNGPVMMIGDGVNDAPALAAADLGVAMGARGAAASAEAADVVLLVDRLDAVLPGLRIAQRSRQIALQSVYGGIGLSILGMIAAALGYIAPVQGALIQEAIDVAVILNALRALRDESAGGQSPLSDSIAAREKHTAAGDPNPA
jgi:cation transport ATPase